MAYVLVQGDALTYPYDPAALRRDFPQVSFPAVMPDERLADHGVFHVADAASPAVTPGKIAEEIAPALVDGVWTRQWAVRDRTEQEFAEAAAAKRAALAAQRDVVLQAGWEHDFGEAGTHRLDLRHADDNANWTRLLIKTNAMIAAGAGDLPVTIRTAANVSIEVSASEANAAMVAFLGWSDDVLAHKWAVADLIDAAEDFGDLAAVDIVAGWPA